MIQVPLEARYYTILKALTTALEGLHAIICLMQTGILWWNDVAFFHQQKKWLHQSWRKYELIFAALYVLHTTVRDRNYR